MMTKIVFLGMCLFAIACNETNEVVAPNQSRISLSVQNLPPLEGGHYQLWATFFQFNKPNSGDSPMHEGEFISLGEFKVMQDGTLRNVNGGKARFGLPQTENPQLLKDIVIAVQTEHNDRFAKTYHDEPGSILIGGAFQGNATTGVADMNIAYADAFRTTFASVTGKCTIVAPTSPSDSNSGVWFVDRSGASPAAGLKNFPTLPPEWRYEGWIVDRSVQAGQPPLSISTGKFIRADSADFDGAGPNRGAGTPFNFPGQDFVQGTFRPNLMSGQFYFAVTIEPFPDNSPKPFSLQLLSTSSSIPAQTRVQNTVNVISQSLPTAKVVIER